MLTCDARPRAERQNDLTFAVQMCHGIFVVALVLILSVQQLLSVFAVQREGLAASQILLGATSEDNAIEKYSAQLKLCMQIKSPQACLHVGEQP